MGLDSKACKVSTLRFRRCIAECNEVEFKLEGLGFEKGVARGGCGVLGVLGLRCPKGEKFKGTWF